MHYLAWPKHYQWDMFLYELVQDIVHQQYHLVGLRFHNPLLLRAKTRREDSHLFGWRISHWGLSVVACARALQLWKGGGSAVILFEGIRWTSFQKEKIPCFCWCFMYGMAGFSSMGRVLVLGTMYFPTRLGVIGRPRILAITMENSKTWTNPRKNTWFPAASNICSINWTYLPPLPLR